MEHYVCRTMDVPIFASCCIIPKLFLVYSSFGIYGNLELMATILYCWKIADTVQYKVEKLQFDAFEIHDQTDK